MRFVLRHVGQEYPFEVEDPVTLHDVKASIWSITGVAVERQRLFGIPPSLTDFDNVTLPRGKDSLALLLTERTESPLAPASSPPPAFEEDVVEMPRAVPVAPVRPSFRRPSSAHTESNEDFNEDDEDYFMGDVPAPHAPAVVFSIEADNLDDASICSLLYSVSPHSHDDLSHAFSTARRERRPVVVIVLNEAQRASQNIAAMWGTMPEMQDLAGRAVVWVCDTHNGAAMHTFGAIAARIPELGHELQHHVRGSIMQAPSVFLFAPGSQQNDLWYAEYGCEASSLHHVAMILDDHGVTAHREQGGGNRTPPPPNEREVERDVIRTEYEAALEEDRRKDHESRLRKIEEDKERQRQEEEAHRAEALHRVKQAHVAAWTALDGPDGVRVVVRKRDGTQTVIKVPRTTPLMRLLEFAFASDKEAVAVADVQVCTTHPRKVFRVSADTASMSIGDIESQGTAMLVVELWRS